MTWQKKARFAIAAFVIAFAAMVFLAMRDRSAAPPPAASPRKDPNTVAETSGPIRIEESVAGKLRYSLTGKEHSVFPDNRMDVSAVTLEIPDKNGRSIAITADKAHVLVPQDKSSQLSTAKMVGNVRLKTSDGITVTTAEASYDDKQGMLTVPGPVQFERGRMKGSGVGATYDRNRDVLWILAQARVSVAPDDKGAGAAEASSGTAGLARADHYMKLTPAAHIVSDDRTIDSDDATILLKEDGETIREVQLRGNSRIVGTGANAQTMSARDIDLTYADDGRTLRQARLMDRGVLELPAGNGGGARRISGNTIDLGLSADGATVTSLNAVGNVQMNLPAEGDAPTKQITASTLTGSGAAGQGLQQATFEGPVEYRETRPAAKGTAAVDRTVRSQRLIVDTKPGLGTIERADFRSNVRITDGPDVTAGAPRANYQIATAQIELSPSGNEPGPAPFVDDGKVLVEARGIKFDTESRKLNADTDVRSTIRAKRAEEKPGAPENGRGARGPANGRAAAARGANGAQPKPAAQANNETRLPSMLAADKPVTVTANRLEYDGQSLAKYDGNARLWQDKSKVYADSIVIDDRTGNLTATGNTKTTMLIEDVDPKTKVRKLTETNAIAEMLVYEEAKRLATYTSGKTGRAHINSAQGDLTADKTELYLREGGNELDRAVSDGQVLVKEGGRTATGGHMVYTAENDTYVMTGKPVEIIEREPSGCKKTTGSRLTFNRSSENVRVEDDGLRRVQGVPVKPCPAEPRD